MGNCTHGRMQHSSFGDVYLAPGAQITIRLKGTMMTDPNAQSPYQPTPNQPAAAPGAPLTAEQDKQWAMWSHIGGIIGFLPSLIIFLVFKDRGPRTAQESKEALNWQITFTIGYIVLWIAVSVINSALWLTPLFGLTFLIGLVPFAWWIINVIFSVMGGMKVNSGGSYRYPFTFRFIK
ncbi:DUF4870 domain-containing protein [Microbacterium sp. STN6]|uniref:DUF4870 domain-containing protein n=1 Tax=Microbacterium sp. STN6 TaxID=2995588 RepID=UPI002260C7FA|nr:DUF4870 domain-containing protein [Microbacterium sp. STN6]MCX7522304.1 DUF4870 domain-containing protein [Microbacterium sp. STN6]